MPRPWLTIGFLMAFVVLVAIWLFIFVQSRSYQQRYPTASAFRDPVSPP